MNALTAAVLFVAIACTSATGILGLGGLAPVHAARGALEGALGGQWIPDVPVAAPAIVAPGAAALAAGHLGLGVGPLGLAGPLGLGLAGHGIASRGALEGALGGQWIPDTHGK